MRLLAIAALIILASCKKDTTTLAINLDNATGVWVPYSINSQNTVLDNPPFTGRTIFDFYAESVKIEKGGSYEAVIYINENDWGVVNAGEHEYKYYPSRKEIVFEGGMSSTFELIKYKGDELWLKKHGTLYKLNRKIKL